MVGFLFKFPLRICFATAAVLQLQGACLLQLGWVLSCKSFHGPLGLVGYSTPTQGRRFSGATSLGFFMQCIVLFTSWWQRTAQYQLTLRDMGLVWQEYL
jgi:hypothetical protein